MAIIFKPNTFIPGTVIRSAEVNADFDTIYSDYNGNIRFVNIHLTNGKILIGNVSNQAIEVTPSAGLLTGFSTGSVLFIGPSSSIAEDNPNFFWDDTNNRLGIGTASPATTLHVNSSGDVKTRMTSGINGVSSLQMGAVNGIALGWDDLNTNFFINYDSPIGTINKNLCSFNPNGEMLLQAVNPPTAKYANRNSFVKAWGAVNGATGALLDGFNCSTSRIIAGDYQIDWTTAFSGTNYVVVANALLSTNLICTVNPSSASQAFVSIRDAANILTDSNFYFMAIGAQ